MPVSREARLRVAAYYRNRCAYCHAAASLILGLVEVEHIVPRILGGTDDDDNLCLACRFCNLHKGSQSEAIDPVSGNRTPLFNPRSQRWLEHFRWGIDGATIVGISACGRATVAALDQNDPDALRTRQIWVALRLYPPDDIE